MSVDDDIDSAPKPPELRELYDLTDVLFIELKRTFAVADTHEFSLTDVDSAGDSLYAVTDKAAFAMRKLQALRHACAPDTRTANTVVVTFVADLVTMLKSLADHIKDTERAAFKVLMDGRVALNKAGVAVSSLNGADIIHLY